MIPERRETNRERCDSEGIPFNQLTEVESRADTVGTASHATTKCEVESENAKEYWDKVLSPRMPRAMRDQLSLQQQGAAPQ